MRVVAYDAVAFSLTKDLCEIPVESPSAEMPNKVGKVKQALVEWYFYVVNSVHCQKFVYNTLHRSLQQATVTQNVACWVNCRQLSSSVVICRCCL